MSCRRAHCLSTSQRYLLLLFLLFFSPLGATAASSTVALDAACHTNVDQSYIKLSYNYRSPIGYRHARLLLHGEQTEASYHLQLRPGRQELYLYLARLSFVPHSLEIPDADSGLQELQAQCQKLPESGEIAPFTAIIGGQDLLLDPASRQLWRRADWQLFRWQLYPQILIIDTAGYAQLSHFFKRLAFYLEKEDHHGTLLEEQALAGRYAWRGHNYSAQGLASFFQEARRLKMPLNSSEQLLLEIALQERLVIESNGYLLPGRGGILGVSWESPPTARASILAHEMLHGIFYSVPAFRNAIHTHWQRLVPFERRAWQELLHSLSYNPADRYLMVNEFHAYLLMYSRAIAPFRLQSIAARALQAGGRPALRRLMREKPDSFEENRAKAAQLLRQHTALQSPNLQLLRLLAQSKSTSSSSSAN